MPIFEFCCNRCGSEFEELVISERDLIACRCGSVDVKKLISVPAPARIVDFSIDPDRGGRFRVDDATFHPSVDEAKVYDFDFGRSERDRLSYLARE